MADDVERTEPPTPKRRREARQEGQVAVSQESFILANLLSATLALMMLGSGILHEGLRVFQQLWQPIDEFDQGVAIDMLATAFAAAGAVILPLFGAVLVGGIGIGLAQTQGNIATKRLRPRASQLNPTKNLSKIFKRQAPIEIPKSLLKLGIVGLMVWFVIANRLEEYFGLSRLMPLEIARYSLETVLTVYLAGCVALVAITLIDYGYQFYRTEEGLKMSRQEVKDEARQSEGDPQVKSRMRSLQYERTRARMMEAVPEADVVVTNPQHVSVALSYKRADMAAPKVVAKGAGILAARIREIATRAGVPIVENPPLARALYRSVKVGQTIPERLYQAVARVLAYVYRLDRSKARSW